MKTLTWITLIVLAMAIGGIQLLVTSGRSVAHNRAVKFQSMRMLNRHQLDLVTFEEADFAALDVEHVGHGVIEFEYQGWKYDAFEVTNDGGKVHVLARKDHLDTALNRVYKNTKRFIVAKCSTVHCPVFNVYFPSIPFIISWSLSAWEHEFHTVTDHYQHRFISAVFAPPWR